jgi:serine/threonine-protein kinase
LFSFLKTKPTDVALADVYKTLNEARAYAEKQGVMHRDISLNNVLVDTSGNANIIDFDIAEYKVWQQI